MNPSPHSWFVASVSASQKKETPKDYWHVKQCSFGVRQGVCCLDPDRSASHICNQQAENSRSELDPPGLPHLLASFFALIQHHVQPKAAMLVSAQQQAMQQIESTGNWIGRRLHKQGCHKEGPHDHQVELAHAHAMAEESKETRSNPKAHRLFVQAMIAQQKCNPELAAMLYEQLIDIQPESDHFARLSKQLTDMTYMPKYKNIPAKVYELNRRAVEVAGMAVSNDSSRPLGHIARCVSRGRLALVSDTRTKVFE
jgi:hypothetical protein